VMGEIRGGIADHARVEAMTATGVLSKDEERIVVRLPLGIHLLSQRVNEHPPPVQRPDSMGFTCVRAKALRRTRPKSHRPFLHPHRTASIALTLVVQLAERSRDRHRSPTGLSRIR